jgi:PAS domain S-box-containing protein
MNLERAKSFRTLWLGLSLPTKGFAMLLLPMFALFAALALLNYSLVAGEVTYRLHTLEVEAAVALGVLTTLGAMALFTRGVVRRLRLIEQSARCLRLGEPLNALVLGDDEVGQLEKQLEITSELLFNRLRKLRESEGNLQAILDQTTAVIYVKDFQGRYLFTNKRYEHIFGITRIEACGRTDAEVFPKQIAKKFRENDLHVLELGRPIQFEEVAPHQDGLHTYLSLKFPLLDAANKPYAVAGISTDITDRKRLENALRRTAEEFSHQTEAPSWEASPPVDFDSPPQGWIADSFSEPAEARPGLIIYNT